MPCLFSDRRLAWLLAIAGLGVLLGRVSLLQGVASVVQIEGGSMAEALAGEHWEFACPHCGRVWQCDAAQASEVSTIYCPECGGTVENSPPFAKHAGQRVIVDRGAYLLTSPRRGEVIAYRRAGESGFGVKRIAALPGETWELRDGELFVEGELVRKSYRQFRQQATLVSEFRSESKHSWKTADDSQWTLKNSVAQWQSENTVEQVQWLTFHPAPAHPAAKNQPSAVQDFDPYNPAISRELNDVIDVLGQCQITASSATKLHFRVHDGREEVVIALIPSEKEIAASRNDRDLERISLPLDFSREREVAWGICDQQLFVAVDDQVILRHELTGDIEAREPSTAPLALGVSGRGECTVDSLHVWRDIYYLDDRGLGRDFGPIRLGDDEYAVLGDNPPLSIDSRQLGSIQRSQIFGRVFPR